VSHQKPKFGIEKPIRISWDPEYIQRLESSGRYVAELKLDEDRGFLVTDEHGQATFFSHRHMTPLVLTGDPFEGQKLPPMSVFDGGHIYSKKLGLRSRIYVFDALVIKGEPLRVPFKERMVLLRQLMMPTHTLWIAPQTSDIRKTFDEIRRKDSVFVSQAALQFGIPKDTLWGFVEGLVIKDLGAKPAFPQPGTKKETPASFKLRTADLLAHQKT
jgi:tetrahydromethanopterin S-methyltransferase subunit F